MILLEHIYSKFSVLLCYTVRGDPQFSAFSKHTKSTLFVYPLPLLSICTIKMLIFACMHAYTISQECVSGVDPGFAKGGDANTF